MSANFERIEAVFSQAVELRPQERAAFLAGACGNDAELLAKVQALLQAHEGAAGFLPEEPRAPAPAGPIAEQPGDRIGHYKLLQQVGEGGCGVVYMAEQEQPVRRRVALKIIKLGMDTKQVVARFEAERQALALMDHPNIAKVLDAGATATGRPYFVMELVRGVRITDYCDQNHLPTPQRLDLFIHVCRAIQHAHQKGIIHRDIKPSNILVTVNDGVPVPKVIDFGIAKATQGRLTDQTLFTAFEQFIGTPAYMSPEQAAMTSLDIDTRSDIYSLGVLLYELLTGQTPFDTKELLAAGLDEMRRTICEKEPLRPSTRLRRTALTTASSPPATRHSPLGTDLDWIVMKCLEKDRGRRYETANGLARDIERHLNHEPVVARPPSALYEFQKAVRRHWVGFGATTAVVGALGLGVVASSWEAVRATKARWDEVAARQRADQAARLAKTQQDRAEKEAQRAKASELAARVAETNALRQAYSASLLSASDALENAQIAAARHYLDSAPANLRGWEWRHLWSRLDLTTRVQERPRSENAQVHVLPDGRSYYDVSAEPTNCIRRWDTQTGQLLATIPIGHPGRRSWLVAGGKRLVAEIVGGDSPKAVEVWDLESGALVSSQPVASWVQSAPDGTRVAFEWEGKIVVMDTKTGTTKVCPTARVSNDAAECLRIWDFSPVRFQPDGRRLAVVTDVGEVALLDADSLHILSAFKAHENAIVPMVFSADSRWLATGSLDNTIRITDVALNPPAEVATLRGHAGWVTALCFSPDASLLASCGEDRTLRLWDTRTGSPRGVFESDGTDPSFLPDGQTLINGDTKGVRFWDVRSSDAWVLRGHRRFVYPVLVSPDGATIYSGGWDGWVGQPGSLRFWDAATGDEIAATKAADVYVLGAALSLDGSRLAVSCASTNRTSGRIEVLDTATGALVASIPVNSFSIESLAFDPAGQTVMWVDNSQGIAKIADARTGAIRKSRRMFDGDSIMCSRVAWSPDGRTVAVVNPFQPTLDILDAQSLQPVRQWQHGHNNYVWSVAFSPDGRRILTAARDGIVRVWDAATSRRLHDLVGHGNHVLCAVYSPDNKRIASGGKDHNIRIWDAETFEQVARLGGHGDYIHSLAWRADSQQLISGSGDYTVRIWETQPLKDRIQARRERQVILAQVEPMVQRLFTELGDASKVVERVKADGSLSRRARQVALQVVLRTSLEQNEKAAIERLVAVRRERALDAGAIKQWLVLAPIDVEGRSGTVALQQEQIPQEARLRPRAGDRLKVGQNERVWKAVQLEDYLIDFNQLLGGETDWSVAYAVCYIQSEADRTGLLMKVGSGDEAKVYLNGKEIYRRGEARSYEPDSDVVQGVELRAGLNVLVFKVVSETREWKGSIRFTDVQGNPGKGIKVTLDPEAKD